MCLSRVGGLTGYNFYDRFPPVDIIQRKTKKSALRSGFWEIALVFFPLWILIASGLFAVLYFAGFTPDYVKEFGANAEAALLSAGKAPSIYFSKDAALIIIPKINLTEPIIFPTSTELSNLKVALRKGVAHYPDSALPGEDGNVFIFGHSSSRVFEKNPALTAFTNLSKLRAGDDILIQFGGVQYHYRATSVQIVDTKETRVYIASDKPKLTLSTCWPVGNPLNRTVVEAEFVEKTLALR